MENNKLSVEYLVLHHSASGAEAGVHDIRSWHLDRGFDDIGYHWVIDQHGDLHPGRAEHQVGAHAYGLNQKSLGICCVGNYEESTPTQTLLDGLVQCLVALCKKYNLETDRIISHRDVIKITPDATVTRCPGEGLYHLIPAIRKAVQEQLLLI